LLQPSQKASLSTQENGFTTKMDDATSFPLAGLNQESESKEKKNMYVPNRGTNEQGQENQEKEVPSARQGDKNSGDIEYNVGAPPPLDLGDVDRSDWSAAEESASF
jgi:hypothetical protein